MEEGGARRGNVGLAPERWALLHRVRVASRTPADPGESGPWLVGKELPRPLCCLRTGLWDGFISLSTSLWAA